VGRCVDGDVAPPLWPWLQVASALGPDGTALRDALRASPTRDGIAARAEMYEAAVAALVDVARDAPLAVVIDDAQWAGAASHHILQLLMARLSDAPLLVVLTVRDGETGTELTATLSAVARTRPATRIYLVGLGAAAIASYVEDRLGARAPDEVVALLAQRTGGNPFFLVELVRSAGVGSGLVDVTAFAETVPATVRDVIDRRIAALPAQSAPILLAASVAGRTFDWRVVAAATQQPAAQALDALDAAVVSGLIEESTTPTRYRFAHDLIRECLYGELSVARRSRLHAAVAETLYELHGDDYGHANEVAAHAWLGRGVMDATDVVDRLLAAAEVTAASLSHEATELLLRRALEIVSGLAPGEERDRLERVATARLARLLPEVHNFSPDEAISLLGRARELLGRAEDKADLPAILNELAVQSVQLGEWHRATLLAEEIQTIAETDQDVATMCNARSLFGLIELDRGRISTAVTFFDEAAELVRRCEPQELIRQFRSDVGPLILTLRGFALALAGDTGAAAVREEAVARAEDVDLAGREFALLFAAWHAVVDDDPSTALRLVHQCGPEAHMGRAAGRLDVVAGWAMGKRGEFAAGLEVLTRGRLALAAVPDVQHAVSALALEADVLLAAGRPHDAAERLNEGFAFNEVSQAALWSPELHRLRGEVILALGEPVADAAAAFAAARAVALEQGAHAFVRRADASAASLAAHRD
jgi:tetratricopeptide (TPR) repeat protein